MASPQYLDRSPVVSYDSDNEKNNEVEEGELIVEEKNISASKQVEHSDDKDINKNDNNNVELPKKRSFTPSIDENEQPPVKKIKKQSGWDLKGEETFSNELSAVEKAKIYAKTQINKTPEQKSVSPTNTEDADVLNRRIYIGSLPFEGITEAHIRSYFAPFGPIVNITYRLNPITGRSKGFCFVDYAYQEAAERAIQTMNGKPIFGRVIRVGPPQFNNSQAVQTNIKPVQQLPFQTNVPPSIPGSRIYVGSINYDLTSNDIRSIFTACGNIISCQLMPNPETGKHKGFGFVDFDSAASAQYAIKVMNGYLIGGRNIRVGPATSNGPASTNTSNNSPQVQSIGKEEDLSISGNERYEIMQKLARGNKVCKTIKLRNMVTVEELNDDGLEDEIAMECSKYGKVSRIILFTADSQTDEVIVYIIFDSIDSATKAINGLDKRWFAKRCIVAEYAINPPPKVVKQIEEEEKEKSS